MNVQFDVKGDYPGGSLYGSIVANNGAESYRLFWDGIYESRTDFFPSYGWFTDLIGQFESKEAAIAAYDTLREDIAMVE